MERYTQLTHNFRESIHYRNIKYTQLNGFIILEDIADDFAAVCYSGLHKIIQYH
jgi:hypothetical protein